MQEVYLIGPMRGKPLLNFPAFEEATTRLRGLGYLVVSPHEKDLAAGYSATHQRPLAQCAPEDVTAVLNADIIALLPGWEFSRMGRVEVLTALAADEPIAVMDAMTLKPITNAAERMAQAILAPASTDARLLGPGGAPTRATILPNDPAARKQCPLASGVLDYFPDALVAVSQVSWKGNQQHNPGQPLFWNRGKSQDESDTLMRHFLQRGTLDTDGQRHSAKVAWRALALLQKELEAAPQLT